MDRLIARLRDSLAEGVSARHVSFDVVNIFAGSRDIEKSDVDIARLIIQAEDYTEVESWIVREGASWLSDGTISISFRIIPKA